MFKRLKSVKFQRLANAGLIFSSIIASFVFAEIILRNSIEYVPLKLRGYLPGDVKILAQNTKDRLIPDSYVALLGDSYAAGWGDWYREALDGAYLGNPPFHSADVIHRLTGLNVLTFAQPGQGSFDGVAYYPTRYHKRLLSRGFPLSDPTVLIIYFYEGNDLSDNLGFLDKYWSAKDLLMPDDVESLVERVSVGNLRNEGPVAAYLRGFEFIHRMYVAKFLYVLANEVKGLVLQTIDQKSDTQQDRTRPIPVRIGSKVLHVLGPVEAPPVQLADSEIARAVSVFESSSHYLMKHFAKSKLLIVYVPSPIMSYQLDTATVPVPLPDGSVQEYPSSRVERVSNRVCQHIAGVASRLGAYFLDARPPIRTAGRSQMIHGPKDWYHFNEVGYKVLGAAVARRLTDAFSSDNTSGPEIETHWSKSQCSHVDTYDRSTAAQLLGPRS